MGELQGIRPVGAGALIQHQAASPNGDLYVMDGNRFAGNYLDPTASLEARGHRSWNHAASPSKTDMMKGALQGGFVGTIGGVVLGSAFAAIGGSMAPGRSVLPVIADFILGGAGIGAITGAAISRRPQTFRISDSPAGRRFFDHDAPSVARAAAVFGIDATRAASVVAAELMRRDTNGDGAVSVTGESADLAATFDRADRDRDGRATRREISAHVGTVAGRVEVLTGVDAGRARVNLAFDQYLSDGELRELLDPAQTSK